jgi:oxygen-independent coproporphyrinogen-3 oxidase
VYLGLRTHDGLALAPADEAIVAPWVRAGWVRLGDDGRLRCTAQGWLRLDGIAAALTASRSR